MWTFVLFYANILILKLYFEVNINFYIYIVLSQKQYKYH